jgi:hypothetical protein
MTAAVDVATRGAAALTGLVLQLLALSLWPVLLGGLLLLIVWGVCALLSIRRPAGRTSGVADFGPPAPEPLPAAGVDPHLPNVVPLADWRRRRATS